MFDPTVIFQRTQAGRDEIQQKSHGLTQSERLVLIMIDGVTAYQGVRGKLPVLTDERFERALTRLLQKDLVCEVFLPIEGQSPDEIERTVIDRFLQQDPLDPVTIIFFDPEDQFGEIGAPTQPMPDPPSDRREEVNFAPPIASPIAAPSEPEPAMDEDHIRLADSLTEEVRARQAARPARVEQSREALLASQMNPEDVLTPTHKLDVARIHWGYWLIALGCAFIAGFFLAKLPG